MRVNEQQMQQILKIRKIHNFFTLLVIILVIIFFVSVFLLKVSVLVFYLILFVIILFYMLQNLLKKNLAKQINLLIGSEQEDFGNKKQIVKRFFEYQFDEFQQEAFIKYMQNKGDLNESK